MRCGTDPGADGPAHLGVTMPPKIVLYFVHNAATYEANTVTGTYAKVPGTAQTLADRQQTLTRSGVTWGYYVNAASNSNVDNPAAFGRLVEWGGTAL